MAQEKLSLADILKKYEDTPAQTVATASPEEGEQTAFPEQPFFVSQQQEYNPQLHRFRRPEEETELDAPLIQDSTNRSKKTMEKTLLKRSVEAVASNPSEGGSQAHIIVTAEGEYDLSTAEGVSGVNQEIRDILTEVEQMMKRIQQSGQAKQQVRLAYGALEKAAKVDASSDDIIQLGEKIAHLGELIKSGSPSRQELSSLVMKIEIIRAVLSRYIDVFWHY